MSTLTMAPAPVAAVKKANADATSAKAASKKTNKATAVTQPTKQQKQASKAAKAAEATTVKKAVAESSPSTKKHPAAKPFKIARDKERKEKQQKQTAGTADATTTTAAASTAAAAAATMAVKTAVPPPQRLQDMEQDGVKSRNHKLFLRQRSGGPCWSGRQPRDPRTESVAERLHDEITEYTKYTRATVAAMAVHIEEMIAHVDRCVHSLWPTSHMEPFGSYSTGIWLPSSDVDLVILGVVELHDRMLTVKSLRQLARALESQPWVESIVVLDTAKIPVLKLVTAESSVPIDITFESTATHSGLLARDLIKRYADEMPELYPLAVVFKQLLRERDLNDAYTGGLSSYSVVLMIIHFQLLWRYGDKCFKAAAVFASGAPLPRPADLLAEDDKEAASNSTTPWGSTKKTDPTTTTTTTTEPEAAAAPAPTITSSFAAVVSRSKSLKRPASEAGRSPQQQSTASTAQPFSYAAVAAGIAKLTTAEDKPPASTATTPTSYAAAVAAPPSKAKPVAKPEAIDAVSVTSSTADTEESSSSAHGEEACADEDAQLSLGERTMTILEFFGIVFDYRTNGLSIRDGGYIYRLADPGLSKASGPPSLVIEDPIHPDRNVSASSFAFAKVVAVFEDAFYALTYFRPSRFTPSALSCLLATQGHNQFKPKC